MGQERNDAVMGRDGDAVKLGRGEEKAKDKGDDGEILTFGLIPDRSLCGETGLEGRGQKTEGRVLISDVRLQIVDLRWGNLGIEEFRITYN